MHLRRYARHGLCMCAARAGNGHQLTGADAMMTIRELAEVTDARREDVRRSVQRLVAQGALRRVDKGGRGKEASYEITLAALCAVLRERPKS